MEGLSTTSYLLNIGAMLAITVGTILIVNHMFRKLRGKTFREKAPIKPVRDLATEKARLVLLRNHHK